MLMDTYWQCPTTCLFTTTPSTDGEQGDLTPQKVGYLYEEQYANECKSILPIPQFLFVFRREGELRGATEPWGFREGRGRKTVSTACKI